MKTSDYLANSGWTAIIIAWVLFVFPVNGYAHDLDFGYLNITEVDDGDYHFLFRFTSKQLNLQEINPSLPDTCSIYNYKKNGLHDVEQTIRWQARCGKGKMLSVLPWVHFKGLPDNQHLMVRLHLAGQAVKQQLSRSNPINLKQFETQVIDTIPSTDAIGFLIIGFEHIIEGYDHLLVVLCFLLLFQNMRQLLLVVTGFTIGHSVSLILVSLYSLGFPVAVVEILITLSITFMARECFMRYSSTELRKQTLIQSYPVAMSSLIGVLHGLGFAAALQDLGLPTENNVPPLLMFNVGIELGQLLFAACGLLTLYCVSLFICYREQWVKIMSVGIGASSVVWLFQLG